VTGARVSRRAVLAGLSSVALAPDQAVAQVNANSKTVLFDTPARWNPAAMSWDMTLHAWVYAPQTSTARKATIAALFKRRYGLEVAPEHQALFDERINLLLADNTRGQRPVVRLGDLDLILAETGSNGHVRQTISMPDPDGPGAVGRGWTITSGDAVATVELIAPTGISVICDIDDTVKDSGVLDKRRLWEATFFKPFAAVPGMQALLMGLTDAERAVHYVSSSPWHLYQPLHNWLAADGFPVSSLDLKQIRLKDSTVLDILKSPAATKPPIIAAILKRYPGRKFILVGDSGEKDPEVYAGTARAFPGQISRILIRRAPGDPSGAERFQRVFAGLPEAMVQVFDQPTEVQVRG
jgi:phosphatidate phosphatase APP1